MHSWHCTSQLCLHIRSIFQTHLLQLSHSKGKFSKLAISRALNKGTLNIYYHFAGDVFLQDKAYYRTIQKLLMFISHTLDHEVSHVYRCTSDRTISLMNISCDVLNETSYLILWINVRCTILYLVHHIDTHLLSVDAFKVNSLMCKSMSNGNFQQNM